MNEIKAVNLFSRQKCCLFFDIISTDFACHYGCLSWRVVIRGFA